MLRERLLWMDMEWGREARCGFIRAERGDAGMEKEELVGHTVADVLMSCVCPQVCARCPPETNLCLQRNFVYLAAMGPA